MKPSTAVENSLNSKIGSVSATYSSQSSCPNSCPFFNKGCYAELGLTGIHTNKLNRSDITDPVEIAKVEASEIKKLSGKKHLRIHVVGDCATDECAKIVSGAASEHMSKHNMMAWTYTHAHNVKRESWSNVSVLRSCETLSQVEQSHNEGFASAMVVTDFESNKPHDIGNGFIGIPCRNQVSNVTCVECKLCLNDKALRKNKRVILFSAHGIRKNSVSNTLRVINNE
jgi:hypothetical protein